MRRIRKVKKMQDKVTFSYTVKNVYGNETLYPVSEPLKKFCAKFGTKTVTPAIIDALAIVGINLVEVFELHPVGLRK